MGGVTYVVVRDPEWRFDPEEVFDALKQIYAARQFLPDRDPRRLLAEGFTDGWEVEIDEKATAFIIGAPPAPLMELVAWVRAYVPAEVALEIYDNQLTFDPTSLRPGITPEQVRAEFFPDAWKIEQMSPSEPPTLEERMRSGTPPHIAELLDREQPPKPER